MQPNYYKAKNMNIAELLKEGKVILAVSAADLKEFGLELIAMARESNEKEEDNELLTIKECCEILNVTKGTLWRWNKSGYLQSVKIGRSPYYRKSDIETLKKGRQI